MTRVNSSTIKLIVIFFYKQDTTWKQVTTSRTVPSITVKGLNSDTEYIFRIKAENRFGESTAIMSEPVVPKNPFSPPSAPGKPQVMKVSKEGILIKWKKPETDGGSIVTGYFIEYKDKNSILWQVKFYFYYLHRLYSKELWSLMMFVSRY